MTDLHTPERAVHDEATGDEGRRTAVLGLALVAVAPLVVVAVDPDAARFVLPITVVAGLGAGLAHRFGTWAAGVAAALGLVALVGVGGGPASTGVRRPDSLFDFLPAWMLVVGSVLAMVGGVSAVLAARRGEAGPSLVGWRRGAPVVLAVLAAASAVLSVTTNDPLTEAELAGAQVVELTESTYLPGTLTATPGQETVLALRNTGMIIHTFTMPSHGIDVALAPGDATVVRFTPDGAGSIPFWCTPHSGETADGGREGMTGSIEVGS